VRRGRREETVIDPPACLGFLVVARGEDVPPLSCSSRSLLDSVPVV